KELGLDRGPGAAALDVVDLRAGATKRIVVGDAAVGLRRDAPRAARPAFHLRVVARPARPSAVAAPPLPRWISKSRHAEASGARGGTERPTTADSRHSPTNVAKRARPRVTAGTIGRPS